MSGLRPIKCTFIFSALLTFLFSWFAVAVFAETAVPFWSEDFPNGIPSNWQTEDETSGSSPALWEHCADYNNCRPVDDDFELFGIFKGDWFNSNTFEDGYVLLSPLEIGGISDAHSSYLETSAIDCSGKSEVFLNFNTLMIAGTSVPEEDAVVQVRVGNGSWVTFTVFKNLNPDLVEEGGFGIQTYNPQTVWLDISSVAANEADVQIRWVWDWVGKEVYFWGLDDIRLLDENPVYDQTVWGEVPGQGDFGGSLGNWTVTSQGTDCKWEWSPDGLVDLPFPEMDDRADFYTCSPTVGNGVALIDAAQCNQFGASISELTSANIDLTAVTPGTRLAVRFHQTGALGNPAGEDNPITEMWVSTDGGISFPTKVDVNPDKAFNRAFSETKTISLPLEATGAPQVKIKFVFAGRFIFWALDDIRIVERHENDLAVVPPNYYSIAPNFSTPVDAVQPFGFAAEVENLGQAPQGFVTLFLTVFDDATSEEVFRDTLFLGTVLPGGVVEDMIFEKLFTPPSVAASYTCVYEVDADLGDDDQHNNKVYLKFEVTDNLFSKCKGPASIDGGFTPNDHIVYEIGNCFWVPPGSNLRAVNLRFAMAGHNQFTGAKLFTNLYKWKTDNTFADENGDSLANFNEREVIASNIFNTNDEFNGSENLRTVFTVPITFDDDEPIVPLEDSTYYIVTVGYSDVEVGGNGQPIPFFIAGSEALDYGSMYWQSFQTGPPQYVSMLRLGTSDDFRANSWGLKRIPFIELEVASLTNDENIPAPKITMQAYPNPAIGVLYVDLGDLKIKPGAELEVIDLWGHTVQKRQLENGFVSQIPIKTTNLSNGSYILRVVSGDRTGSIKFTVVNERR